jgi:hypothetical protein
VVGVRNFNCSDLMRCAKCDGLLMLADLNLVVPGIHVQNQLLQSKIEKVEKDIQRAESDIQQASADGDIGKIDLETKKMREKLDILLKVWANLIQQQTNLIQQQTNLIQQQTDLIHMERVAQPQSQLSTSKLKVVISEASALNLMSTSNPNFSRIEAEYHCGSGIQVEGKDLVLYRRGAVIEQHKFLSDDVISNAALGWIIGPPGSGKSSATFSFVASLDREKWEVMWIHLSRWLNPSIVIFHGNSKESMEDCTNRDIQEILERFSRSDKMKFLVVDGYVQGSQGHDKVLATAYTWRKKDSKDRRLVVVCSMPSRRKENIFEDINNNVKVFDVFSWTLEEYLNAVKFHDFWVSVRDNFDAFSVDVDMPIAIESDHGTDSVDHGTDSVDREGTMMADDETFDDNETDESTSNNLRPSLSNFDNSENILHAEQMVNAKFQYAGACARFMFSVRTADVKLLIDHAISMLGNPKDLIAGDRSENAINRLYACYKNTDGQQYRIFVSRYAETQIALTLGPELVKILFSAIQDDCSGSGKGSLFEALFFLKMRAGDVVLRRRNLSEVEFKQTKFISLYPKGTVTLPTSECWFRPTSDVNGGFDAVYVNKADKFARFIQLARGKSHTFLVKFFRAFLDRLVDCEIETVEICFVIRHQFLHTFKIDKEKVPMLALLSTKVRNRIKLEKKDLARYKIAGKLSCWEKDAEDKDITFLSMDDISHS